MKNIPVGTRVKCPYGNGVVIQVSFEHYEIKIDGDKEDESRYVPENRVEPEEQVVADRLLWEEAQDKMDELQKCINNPVYFYETYWRVVKG